MPATIRIAHHRYRGWIMNRLGRGLAALLIACGLIGCQEKTSTNDPNPPTVEKPSVAPTRSDARDGQLKAHHDRCVDLFVKTEGNGFSRMVILSHVSPDYPKSLDLPPEQPELDAAGNPLPPRPVTWVMEKVELVSMLNQEKSGVYPARGMGGRRPALGRPKIRDLDTFEEQALARLQGGEELQVSTSAGEMRMLGAIRLRAECARCHDKPAGTLLGAFTYVLKPAAAGAQ
jgi:hypothetical protein